MARIAIECAERAFRMRLKMVTGNAPPNVDTADRDALYDLIDGA